MITGKQQPPGAHAAPRRRFRTEDDAGYLGDAPILLHLPSLCGVPDIEGPLSESTEEPDSTEWVEPNDSPEESHETSDDTSASRLAAPAFTESQASRMETEDDDPEGDESERLDDELNEEFADEEPAAGSSIHRKIILGTALFVIVAASYLYFKRPRPSQDQFVAPAVDVNIGWETEGAMADSVEPSVEPAYGSEYQIPGIDPTSPQASLSDPTAPIPNAPLSGDGGDVGADLVAPLPQLNESAESGDFEIQRIGMDYPHHCHAGRHLRG